MMNVDKKKLVLVHNKDDLINDIPLETKEIGYYKDSWLRFKKNKASLIAFYILIIVMFFVAVGPYMKDYTLPTDNSIEAARLGNLTPKVPVLEKIGIFDGSKVITRGKRFLLEMYNNEYGKDVIISGVPQELIDNPNHPDYADVTELTVKVDYYHYVNYVTSYMPDNYFGVLDSNLQNDANEECMCV